MVRRDRSPEKRPDIDRATFVKLAQPIEVVIDGVAHQADVKHFSTGSYGYYLSIKTLVRVGGGQVRCQVGLNVTVVNSKDEP